MIKMKRHLLEERQKKLAKRQAQMIKYGQRLDRISEEHVAYYHNVIITAYEQNKKKEEELAKREEELTKREEELARKENDLPKKIESYQKYIDESTTYIQQQQEYIAFLGDQIKTLEIKKKSLQGAIQVKKPASSKLLKPPGFNKKG